MFRLSGLVSIMIAVGCGALLFLTSQSVQKAEQKLSQVKQSNRAEQETLRVLSAEWDYLNRPERLESLTRNNFDLDYTLTDKKTFVSTMEEIPEPMVPVLPKIKPDFLRHVSTASQKSKIENEPDIIHKVEPKNFDKLLDGLSAGGQE